MVQTSSPKIVSFSARPIIEKDPPDEQQIRPHAWLSDEMGKRYERRLSKKGYFELYISKLAAEKMINHAKKLGRINKEALGFILGDICSSKGRDFVMVRDIVTGALVTTPNSVRFDHDNLSRLFSELDASGFDYVIVGWYHSHPGYGCFMSKLDINTQSVVFSEKFHSAIVIDPLLKEVRAFRLKGNRCFPLDFTIYWHELEAPYGRTMIKRTRIFRKTLK